MLEFSAAAGIEPMVQIMKLSQVGRVLQCRACSLCKHLAVVEDGASVAAAHEPLPSASFAQIVLITEPAQ